MGAYQPVSCGLHSEFELLAMRQSRVRLTYIDPAMGVQVAKGRVLDVLTRQQAEYLLLEVAGDGSLSVRLDRIQHWDKA